VAIKQARNQAAFVNMLRSSLSNLSHSADWRNFFALVIMPAAFRKYEVKFAEYHLYLLSNMAQVIFSRECPLLEFSQFS
jgi:hypothetical protein